MILYFNLKIVNCEQIDICLIPNFKNSQQIVLDFTLKTQDILYSQHK